jgi:hypothetical protein
MTAIRNTQLLITMSVSSLLLACGFTSAEHVKNTIEVIERTATIDTLREVALRNLEANCITGSFGGKADFLATVPTFLPYGCKQSVPLGSGLDDDGTFANHDDYIAHD